MTIINRLSRREREILQKHLTTAPIRLSALARDLGVEVRAASLPAGISGEIRPNEGQEDGFTIRVNRHEIKKRQRFTVAHEIAHFLLHKEHIGNGITDDVLYRSSLSDRREAEANRLAADILMPRNLINEKLKELQGHSTDEIVNQMADAFAVSEPAMRIRLNL